jgi:hypothetical protein
MTTFQWPSIDATAYAVFKKMFNAGTFAGQRFGQAFYNHYSLHKLADQTSLGSLYELDGAEARAKIEQLFNIH